MPGVKVAEPLAGSDTEAQQHILNNQVQTTRLGGQVLGKRNATEVTEADVREANKTPGATYDAAGQRVGTFQASPDYQTAIQGVKEDPNAVQAGLGKIQKQAAAGPLSGPEFVEQLNFARQKGAWEISNAMEDELERQLNAQGKDGQTVLANLRAARQQFARNYQVRDALEGDQVNAKAIAKAKDANPDIDMGHELETIASANKRLPGSPGFYRAARVAPDTYIRATGESSAKGFQ